MIDSISMCMSCGRSFYIQSLDDPGTGVLLYCPFCSSSMLRDLDEDLIPTERRRFLVLPGDKKKTPPEEAGLSGFSTDEDDESKQK